MNNKLPLRILLVEDDVTSRRAIERLLQGPQRAVTVVASLSEAQQACAAGEFDVLLADIGLPDGTALSLARLLKDRCGALTVAMTGHCSEQDQRAIRSAGFDCFLPKPIAFKDLDEILEKERARRAGARLKRSDICPPAANASLV